MIDPVPPPYLAQQGALVAIITYDGKMKLFVHDMPTLLATKMLIIPNSYSSFTSQQCLTVDNQHTSVISQLSADNIGITDAPEIITNYAPGSIVPHFNSTLIVCATINQTDTFCVDYSINIVVMVQICIYIYGAHLDK